MTRHTSKLFVLIVAFILLVSAVPVSGHDIVLELQPEYVEGWNGTGGDPENALIQYDVDADGADTVQITTYAGSIGNDDGNGSLHVFSQNAKSTFSTVELNQTNHTVFLDSPSENITFESRLRGEFNTNNLGTDRNGFRVINDDGEYIAFRAQYGWDDFSANYPSGWVIAGNGVETSVTRESGLFSSASGDTAAVDGNWTFWIDQSTGELGLKSDNMNGGPLTTQTVSGWSNTDTIRFQYIHAYSGSSSGHHSRSYWDYLNVTGVNIASQFTVNGTILDPAGNPIKGATVTTSTGEEITTGQDGEYSFDAFNGTYTVTANADGFKENETSVTVDGADVTHDIVLQNEIELRLDVNPWMDHGSTQPYEVWEVFENRSDVEVTENATVTSGNTTVIVVNTSSTELEATGDISINEEVVITAVYNNSTTTENVTVANLTVQNIDILPPWRRLAALIGDVDNVGGTQKTFLWLIIVMLASVVATHYTSAFGGLSTGVVLLTFGWVPGWVSTGVVLIGLFTGMFLAFNVAMNIDYTVMRNRP